MIPVIAVDFGGTHIRAAYFPPESIKFTQHAKIDTEAEEGPKAVIDRVEKAIQSVARFPQEGLRIGIAAPGPLDPFKGIILSTPNLPGWDDVPLADEISKRFNCPVVLNNDANLAALGEWKHGAGRGVDDLIYLTISTGIGGGVISQGRMLIGAHGLAGELGHMRVVQNGPLCGCGQYGHIEAIASGLSIARNVRHRLEAGEESVLWERVKNLNDLTSVVIGEAAEDGDALAISAIENAGKAIGSHIASLIHAFNPVRVIIGGGLSQLGDLLFTPIRQTIPELVIHPGYLQNLEVVPAELGDDAGLIGAMVFARQD
jgi:glucokinase